MRMLVPVDGSPGLLQDPDYIAGDPGTFAVIIGVSRYLHLDGGPEPASDTYGLGQLYVSAATACRLFLWLRDRYSYPDAAPAQCWLLLSSTDAERTRIGGAGVGAAEATMANCAAAIGAWAAALDRMPRASAAKSRALFFFSGHGIEVWPDRQILLPTDYLAPPTENVNEAISTEFLRKGLASCPVAQQFLFVDACRNDTQGLKELDIEGRKILNLRGSAHVNPDIVAPVFYAATSGTQTYQPRELDRGYSLFGDALAEGLSGADGLELNCTGETCEIRPFPLHTYLKGRVAQLLESFGVSPTLQHVRLRGEFGALEELPITLVRRRAPSRGPAVGALLTVAPSLEIRYSVRHDDMSWRPADGYQAAHDLFGSENVTDLWTTVRIHDLEHGDTVPADGLAVRYVHRSEDTATIVVGFELPPSPHGHWMQFEDRTGMSFACALPGDEPVPPTYEIEMDVALVDPPGAPRPIRRLEAAISPQTTGFASTAAGAWATHEQHNLSAAIAGIDLNLMAAILREKRDSPLTAAIAGWLLLRGGREDLYGRDWLRNLSDWFPQLPDGAVLWAEQLRQESRRSAESEGTKLERIEHLSRLAVRGLPRISESLASAVDQLDDLAADRPLPESLIMVRERLKLAVRFHRPGGLFAVFAGSLDAVGPHLLRPSV